MDKLTMCREFDCDCSEVEDKQACQDGTESEHGGVIYYTEYVGWCPYLVKPKMREAMIAKGE